MPQDPVPADTGGDLDPDALRSMRGLVRAGVESRARILEILVDEMAAVPEGDRARAAAELDRAIAAKAAEEASWPAVLDTDRLDRAFEALGRKGVLCLHDAGYDQSDGFGDAEELREEKGGDASGFDAYCFYHRQDVEGALEGRGLYLAFGSFAAREGDVKVGRRIEHQLAEAGLRVEWDGTAKKRLHLPGFDFRRRGVPADEE